MPFGLTFRERLGFLLAWSHFFSVAGFSSRPLAFLLAFRLQLEIQLRGKNEHAIGRKTWLGTIPARIWHESGTNAKKNHVSTNPPRIRHESGTNPARIRHESGTNAKKNHVATNPARIQHESDTNPARTRRKNTSARIRHESATNEKKSDVQHRSRTNVKNLVRLRRKDQRVAFTYGIVCRRI